MNNNNTEKAPNVFICLVIGAAIFVGLSSLASSNNASTTQKANVVLTSDNGITSPPSSETTPATRKPATESPFSFGWEKVPPDWSPTTPEYVSPFDLDFGGTTSPRQDYYDCACIGGQCSVCNGRKDTSLYSYNYAGPEPCTYCNATGNCPRCKGRGIIFYNQ